MSCRGLPRSAALGAAIEEGGEQEVAAPEVPMAKAPSMGFGPWSALARKQKPTQPTQLDEYAAGKAIAMEDRNEIGNAWRKVFVVPVSRFHNGMAEVFDEYGNPIHEPDAGVAYGLQPLSQLQHEMDPEWKYYQCPESYTPVPSPMAKSRPESTETSAGADADCIRGATSMCADSHMQDRKSVV